MFDDLIAVLEELLGDEEITVSTDEMDALCSNVAFRIICTVCLQHDQSLSIPHHTHARALSTFDADELGLDPEND